MADSTITQTTLAFLTALEAAFNTHGVTAAVYTTYETLARIFIVPDNEKRAFQPRTGAGAASAYPVGQTSGVMNVVGIDITDVVNTEIFPTFGRMQFGQTEDAGDIDILDATIAWRHHFYKQNFDTDGRQFDSRSWIVKNNGADFIYTGGVANSLQIQQNGVADPQFTFGVLASGNYVDISQISPSFGALAVPSRDEFQDMMGAETIITYDDGTPRSLQGRWISFNWTSNNNVNTQQLRAGLPRVDAATCPERGWYRNQLLASDETYSAEFRVAHDATMREWDHAQTNQALTSFDISMNGNCIPTTTNDTQYGVKCSIGKSYFRNIRGGDDNNDAVLDVAVFPVRNGSYFGVHKMEVVNGQETIIV